MSLFGGIRYYLLADKSKYQTLKEILGFLPKNIHLYDQAFTHKSVVSDSSKKESNERLEYLGDAVLGAIVAEYLFKLFPYEDEGFLTTTRSKMVSRNFLNKLAVDLGIDTFIQSANGTVRSKSMCGDAFEALVGAIFLDKGFKSCRKFVLEKIISDHIDIPSLLEQQDYKSDLVKWCQKNKKSFDFQIQEKRNDIGVYFSCTLFIGGKEISKAESKSKKEAEQASSKLFFDYQSKD